jgi:hypothetical protein
MKTIRWLRVLRDVAMIWVISFLGGLFFVLTGSSTSAKESDTFWGTVGFVTVGCMTKENRFQHIAAVGIVFWLTHFFVIFFGATMAQWFTDILLISLMAALGGGISNLFVNRKPRF